MGYVDDEGYLYLTDRRDFMIVSGGVNIYPQEAENLLITHPKVMDVGGVRRAERRDGRGGEGGRAADRHGGRRSGARDGADRVLPRAPRALQVPGVDRLRRRAPAPADRQALQAAAPRPLLGRAARAASSDRRWTSTSIAGSSTTSRPRRTRSTPPSRPRRHRLGTGHAGRGVGRARDHRAPRGDRRLGRRGALPIRTRSARRSPSCLTAPDERAREVEAGTIGRRVPVEVDTVDWWRDRRAKVLAATPCTERRPTGRRGSAPTCRRRPSGPRG